MRRPMSWSETAEPRTESLMWKLRTCWLMAAALIVPVGLAAASGDFRLDSLSLPGIPAAVITADVDGDGSLDLVVAVVHTSWESVATTESQKFDGVEGWVEVMNVVPALLSRRELWVYFQDSKGDFGVPEILRLESSVLGLLEGPPGLPVLALTDEGVSALRYEDSEGQRSLVLEALIARAPLLAGSGRFFSDLDLLHDLNGDGHLDLLLPVEGGWWVFPGTGTGFSSSEAVGLAVEDWEIDPESRRHGAPRVIDLDADGLPDLVSLGSGDSEDRDEAKFGGGVRLYRNLWSLRFDSPVEIGNDTLAEEAEEIAFVGDIDGDGPAEIVTQVELEVDEEAGWREEVGAAKRPHFVYRAYGFAEDLDLAPEGVRRFSAVGYAFQGDGDDEVTLPGGFQDLDGDGRSDLWAVHPLRKRHAQESTPVRLDLHRSRLQP